MKLLLVILAIVAVVAAKSGRAFNISLKKPVFLSFIVPLFLFRLRAPETALASQAA